MTIRKLFAAMCPERPVDAFRPGCRLNDRRSGIRISHPRRVQVFHEHTDAPDARPDISVGVMKNFSADGCNLYVQGGVAAETVWVRLFGQDQPEEFIECRVTWKGDAPPNAMQPCGVQFKQTLSREEFEARVSRQSHAISA